MEQYSWVSEGSIRKFHRAVAELTKANATRKALNQDLIPLTEQAIKDLYVKWGGLIVGDESSERGTGNEAAVAPVELPAEAPAEVKEVHTKKAK